MIIYHTRSAYDRVGRRGTGRGEKKKGKGRNEETLIHFNNIYGNAQWTLYCLIHPLTYSTTMRIINYTTSVGSLEQ